MSAQTDAEECAFARGSAAFHDGVPVEKNPYLMPSLQFAWKQGWTDHGAAPVEIVLPWPLMKKPDGARRDEQTDPLPRF